MREIEPPTESHSSASNKPHVAIFPLMAQGHTIPLVDFSKTLSSRGVRVTIITTPSNVPSILSRLSGDTHRRNITLAELPFSFRGCENTSELSSLGLVYDFLIAAQIQLRSPFEALLRRMRDSNDLPNFVVSDFFLGFTLSVCQDFNVPRLVFHGMGVSTLSAYKAAWTHKPYLLTVSGSDSVVDLPAQKLPYSLTLSDFPLDVLVAPDLTNPKVRLFKELHDSDNKSWGVLVNSFSELEMVSIPFLESFYANGARAWCVGPLFLYDEDDDDDDDDDHVTRWLDEHSPGSVLYVAFGTQSFKTDSQLDELARGLVGSGEPFLWVVKSSTWSVPSDIKERVNDKGLVVSGWVNQRKILGHASVGGFLSHCGWNSVLESLSVGIPILAWPFFGDQPWNAKLVVDGIGTGIRVLKPDREDGLVSRTAISKGVRDLMSSEKGRAARKRAQALGCDARRAVGEGGSSRRTLDKLVRKLCEI